MAILDGRSIHRESLIDLLTAKDVKTAEDVGDFVSAMKVLRDWQQQEVSHILLDKRVCRAVLITVSHLIDCRDETPVGLSSYHLAATILGRRVSALPRIYLED